MVKIKVTMQGVTTKCNWLYFIKDLDPVSTDKQYNYTKSLNKTQVTIYIGYF